MKIIYHTSHCGSTLLTAILAQNNIAFAEPNFSELIMPSEQLGYSIDNSNYKQVVDYLQYTPKWANVVIKFSTAGNMTSIFNKKKKVFLYNNLKRHMFKYINHRRIDNYMNHYFKLYLNTPYPKLNFDFHKNEKNQLNLNQVSVFMWAYSMYWLLESENCLCVNSEEFFFDRVNTVDRICDYLELEKPHDYFPKNYVDKKKYFDKGKIIKHEEAYKSEKYNESKTYDTEQYDIIKDYALKHYKLLEPYFENEKHI